MTEVIDELEKQRALDGARFLHPNEDLLGGEVVREPSDYLPTDSFRNRMRELGGIVDGGMINDAIQYGEAVRASDGCNAYVLFRPGVTFSFIWEPYDGVQYAGRMISVWPYLYNREKALDTGLWSSSQLYTIEEVAATNAEERD